MTDLINMTKPAQNALLTTPLSASKLKKTAKADLIALFDAMPATDALDADLRDARANDYDPTPPKARKPRTLEDRVIVAPGKADDIKPTKSGSKRGLLVQALQRGTTLEHLVELLGCRSCCRRGRAHTGGHAGHPRIVATGRPSRNRHNGFPITCR